jgi:hypothetical protein
VGCQLGDGQVLQQMLSKHAGPGSLQEEAAFFAEEGPGIKQVAGVVIADGQHAIRVAPGRSPARRLFAAASTFDHSSAK